MSGAFKLAAISFWYLACALLSRSLFHESLSSLARNARILSYFSRSSSLSFSRIKKALIIYFKEINSTLELLKKIR